MNRITGWWNNRFNHLFINIDCHLEVFHWGPISQVLCLIFIKVVIGILGERLELQFLAIFYIDLKRIFHDQIWNRLLISSYFQLFDIRNTRDSSSKSSVSRYLTWNLHEWLNDFIKFEICLMCFYSFGMISRFLYVVIGISGGGVLVQNPR